VRTNPNPTFLDRLGPRALQPWAMGQCLEGHSQATMGDVTDGRGLQTTLYVHVPTVSSLAGLPDRLVTSVIIGLGLTIAIRNKGLGTGQQVCRREPGKVDLL
jgi:hypothetical protein